MKVVHEGDSGSERVFEHRRCFCSAVYFLYDRDIFDELDVVSGWEG